MTQTNMNLTGILQRIGTRRHAVNSLICSLWLDTISTTMVIQGLVISQINWRKMTYSSLNCGLFGKTGVPLSRPT